MTGLGLSEMKTVVGSELAVAHLVFKAHDGMLRRATVPTSHNQNSGLEYLLVSPSTGTNRDHFLQADSPYLSARCPTGLLPNRRRFGLSSYEKTSASPRS
jgi:hypothetical protein